MMRWIEWVVRLAIGLSAIVLIWTFVAWWRPDPPTTYLRTDLINAQQSDAFFTGFATVAVVKFDTGADELYPFSLIENESRHDDITGYCYRIYDVAIGYPSLRAVIDHSEAVIGSAVTEAQALDGISVPQVLSGNVVEARHGGSAKQYDCDDLNVVSAARPNRDRLERLRGVLVYNGQWDSHVAHARNVITAFSRTLAERRRDIVETRLEAIDASAESLREVSDDKGLEAWKTRARRMLAPPLPDGTRSLRPSTGMAELDSILAGADPVTGTRERGLDALEGFKQTVTDILQRESAQTQERLASAGGYLGTLKLTFSTVGIFGQQAGRWFWKRGQFYIRQDLADATYGSDFALDVARTSAGFLGPKRLEITIPEPTLLALDRYTTVLVAKPRGFTREGDNEGTEIERALSGDLAEQLARVEPHAIRFAKAAMTAQVHSLVESNVSEIRVRFAASGDRNTPGQLADLVRLMRESDDGDTEK